MRITTIVFFWILTAILAFELGWRAHIRWERTHAIQWNGPGVFSGSLNLSWDPKTNQVTILTPDHH